MMKTVEHNYHISRGLKDFFEDLDFKLNHPNELRGISTGYDYLDAKLDGLKAGEVTIIGARPAMGKTSLAINMTYNIAANFYAQHQQNEQDNRCVVYVGLEYLPKEFAQKLIALQTLIPNIQLQRGAELDKSFEEITQAERAINELPIYYFDDAYEVDGIEVKLHILSANITDKEEIENPLVVLGINPSTADTASADPTINSVKKIAQFNKIYDGFIMINVFPLRATDPDELPVVGDDKQIEKNTQIIYNKLKLLPSLDILLAYGNNIENRAYLSDCLRKIYTKLTDLHPHYKVIDITSKGHPRHPLYASPQIISADFNLIKIRP